jgi:hypothetical protein
MPRSTTPPEGGHRTIGHVLATEAERAFLIVPPWLGLLLLPVWGLILRLAWPNWWAAGSVLAGGLALTAWGLHITHHRKSWAGRLMAPVTVLASSIWLVMVDLEGFTRRTIGIWFIGGAILAIGWSMWVHVRTSAEDGVLSFDAIAEHAGMRGTKVVRAEVIGRKIVAVLRHPPGVTGSDMTKRAGGLESALGKGLPPGSATVTPDEDNARHSKLVLSDPRLLKRSQPWPGPSRPGASISQPIVPGVWQDGTAVPYVVTNHHLKIMGMTGAGKSLGWGWCEVAETVTRRDAAVLAIDITKGEQTLGPLRPALHRFETSVAGAVALLEGVDRAVRARKDYLASMHLGKWEEGCGLTHLTVWLEEVPDIWEALDDAHAARLLSNLKAGRSAGIRWAYSLQRSDWTQMPTLADGQLANACFGVKKAKDAAFGLSEIQAAHGVQPELWADTHPGMLVLDAPTIREVERKVMPMRTWDWGRNDSLIAAHAAEYPMEGRPLDGVTRLALAPPRPQASPAAAQARATTRLRAAPDPPPEEEQDMLGPDEPDDPLTPDSPAYGQGFTLPDAGRMTPDAARVKFREMLGAWADEGRTTIGSDELAEVSMTTGRSRTWPYGVLKDFEAEGLVKERGGAWPRTWEIAA